MTLDEIVENFELLDEMDDRYRYLIELGRDLEPLDEAAHNEDNKVRGCASQVWVDTRATGSGDDLRLHLRGDSDANIVKGLIRLVFAQYNDRAPSEIVETDIEPLFERLGMSQHITRQRTNGVRAMVDRIKADARKAAR